jgi:hypothetical protein
MATYTININERTKAGKNLVAFLRSLKGVVSFRNDKTMPALDEALEDKKNGKTFRASNAKELIDKCLS